jgi:Condensation domain
MTGFDASSAAEATAPAPGGPAGDLFPLPLSPFERYMALDDTAAYPMTFVWLIKLKGNLLREPFEQAVQFALERHPLLASRICPVRGKGPCWVPVAAPAPQICWRNSRSSQQAGAPSACEASAPNAAVRKRFDLAREIGLRITVDATADATASPTVDAGGASADVWIEFHHACTDGIGAVQFIGDLLARYGQLTAQEGAELPEIKPLNLDALRARADYSTNQGQQAARSFSYGYMLGRLTKLLLRRRPVPVARPRSTHAIGTPQQLPALVSRTLDATQVQQLKAAAARQGVTLNDLYLLETFRTIRAWNQQQARGTKRGDRDTEWLRIGMPTSLRTPAHDAMPAANVVSYMFLARQASDCDRPDAMLARIRRQTSLAVHARLGRITALGLKYVQKVPGLLWCLLRRNRCFCTAILTNVGDVQRQLHARFPFKDGRYVAGNVTLESLTASPTIRRQTRLAICLLAYAGTVSIGVQCDPHSFTREQAEELADSFVNRLRQAASNPASLSVIPHSNAA